MALSIGTVFSSKEERHVEKSGSFFYEVSDELKKYIKLISIPFKGASILFSWGEIAPLKPSLLSLLAKQKCILKTVCSTFHIPLFFLKEIRLYRSVEELNASQKVTARNVKNVFFDSSSLFIATLKIPLSLNKARWIDLTKYSRMLPAQLGAVVHVLSFALLGGRLIDRGWALAEKIQTGKAWDKAGNLKPKTLKEGLKFTSKMFSLVSAACFLVGFQSFLLFLTLSSVSFCLSLAAWAVAYNHVKNHKSDFDRLHALPA